jgi:GT2 family glycosyltransferase
MAKRQIMNHTIAILGFNHHDITMKVINRVMKKNPNCKVLFFDNGSIPPFKDLLDPSIEYVRKPENVYVNPAWNEIFDLCSTKYVTLLNNDCLPLRESYFDYVIQDMEDNGLSMSSCKTIDIKALTKTRIFVYGLWDKLLSKFHMNPVEKSKRQGWLMTLNLENYKQCDYKIPNELKVWYGDDWIADQLFKNGFKRVVYKNALAIHVQSTSSGSDHIKAVIKKDSDIIRQYDIDFENSIHANKRLKWFR